MVRVRCATFMSTASPGYSRHMRRPDPTKRRPKSTAPWRNKRPENIWRLSDTSERALISRGKSFLVHDVRHLCRIATVISLQHIDHRLRRAASHPLAWIDVEPGDS